MTGSNHPTRVPDVSTLPCPGRRDSMAQGLPHQIENATISGRRVESVCIYCHHTWADLDEQLRATLPNHGRDPV